MKLSFQNFVKAWKAGIARLRWYHLVFLLLIFLSGPGYEHIQSEHQIYPGWIIDFTTGSLLESLGEWIAESLYYSGESNWLPRGSFFQMLLIGIILLSGISQAVFINSWKLQRGIRRTLESIVLHIGLFIICLAMAPLIYNVSEIIYEMSIWLIR